MEKRDAIYYKDPKILYNALCSYPINQLSKKSKKLWRELLEINRNEIPIEFQNLKYYI
ncbi:MAG: hypothetical protein NC816_05955 [Candidatus Omnitrophica bacterium]|nr:hypothetical protein [Candidatus Omnitrophota bacterium]